MSIQGTINEVGCKAYLEEKFKGWVWKCTHTFGKLDRAGIDLIGKKIENGKIQNRLVQVKSSLYYAEKFIEQGNSNPQYKGIKIEVMIPEDAGFITIN